ncbi:NYN domain protein [Enhygromyxa salina]|uniref:NYN domain protein n=1 Tax=Enhygromyxa salina TaxID=215803 RepID=A0A2S9XXG2_9BACT|nr:NYN domain-containing protein [Enhygromyxa salina]PRP97533.1 NYN domain protein [Enhygromyxa salina]
MPSERVAMFIDFENLVYGVENTDAGVDPRDHEFAVDIQRIVRFVRDEGRLVLARAYADWRSASVRQHQRDLYVQGIETIHVLGRRHGNEIKNSVDVALAVDAVRSLYEREYDTFVLVSGDRDFLPLLRVVREHGHRIIGVSVRESASRDLPNLCDRFVYYRDLWRTWGPEDQRDWGRRSELEIRDLAVFKEHLRQLLADEVGAGGILGATLKPMIRNRIDPGFDETQFGFLKFSKMLEAMPDIVRFEYTNDAHGGDIRVFAVETNSSNSSADPDAPLVHPTLRRPSGTIISRPPIQTWEPTPEAFLTRARARLARTGLHLDLDRRSGILELIHAELPTGDEFRSQAVILEGLEGRPLASGAEVENSTLRRYLWALYQSWVFDIDPPDRGLDHLERGLRLRPEYRELDRLRLRVEQSLVYKVYELLPDEADQARARVCDLLEVDDDRARELLERVEEYRRSQQQRGR